MNFYDRSKPVELSFDQKVLINSGWGGILLAIFFYFSPQIHPAFVQLTEKIPFGDFEFEMRYILSIALLLMNTFWLIIARKSVWKSNFLKQHGDKTKAKIFNIETKKQRKDFSSEKYDKPTKIVLQVANHEIVLESGKLVLNQKNALEQLAETLFKDKKIGDEIDIIINPEDPTDYIFA